MQGRRGLSRKGERRAAEILEATLRCLARDGYAGTSLQRVADEAGVHKRTVIYYYGTREALFEQVVRHVGDQMLSRFGKVVESFDDPAQRVAAGVEEVWKAMTTDRALLVAWFGLLAESVTNPAMRETTSYINARLRAIIARVIDGSPLEDSSGPDRDVVVVLALAALQGLTLDYLERGDAPDLMQAVEFGQAWLTRQIAAGGS